MNELQRHTEQVPLLNATPFVAFVVEGAVRPPKRSLTLVVKATLTLPDGEVAEEQRFPEGDVRIGDDDDPDAPIVYASDFAPFKPRADVTAKGYGYSQGAGGTTGLAELRLGTLSASVALFGPRRWDAAGAQTAPEPFERVPLHHGFAYGGEGVDENPVGCGRHGRRLPQLEDPNRLMRSASDSPPVACFAPMPPTWPARARHLGTYGKGWLRDRWPFFAEDLDWAHFNAAPAHLQVDHPRGDEPFRLSGMRPQGQILEGKLPGICPQAHARHTPEAGGHLVPIPMSLDTVHFDAEALEVVLVWRGIVEIDDPMGSELAALFVSARSVDEECASDDAIEQALMVAWREEHGEDEDDSASQEPDDESRPPPLPPISREQMVAMLESGESLIGFDMSGADLSGLSFEGRDLSRANLTGADLTDAHLLGARLAGASLDGIRADGCDFRRCDFTEADLSRADLSRARLDEACLRDALLHEARLEGASLRGTDGTGATMTGAEASKADFTGSTLTSCDLSKAQLTDARFDEARLDDAMFYDACAVGASFAGAKGDDLRLDGADLSGASLENMQGPGTSAEGAKLVGAHLRKCDLSDANLALADLRDVVADGCNLKATSLRRAKLAKAKLAGSSLMQADLQEADLSGADLRHTNLYEAETWGATLADIVTDGAVLSGTKLEDR